MQDTGRGRGALPTTHVTPSTPGCSIASAHAVSSDAIIPAAACRRREWLVRGGGARGGAARGVGRTCASSTLGVVHVANVKLPEVRFRRFAMPARPQSALPAARSKQAPGGVVLKTAPTSPPSGAFLKAEQKLYSEQWRQHEKQKQQHMPRAPSDATAELNERVAEAEAKAHAASEQLSHASSTLASMRSSLAREQLMRQRAEDVHQITLQEMRHARDENVELKAQNRALLDAKRKLADAKGALQGEVGARSFTQLAPQTLRQ